MSTTGEKYDEEDAYSSEELTKLLVNLRVPAIKTKEQAWDNFEVRLVGESKAAKKRSLNYLIYAIAASIALLIGISSWFYYNKETKVWCPPAQMVTVTLPDGSQIVLNAVSTIHFNKRSWSKTRLVQLEGEAFFRVKKGRQFEVATKTGKIMVLGTTFNVFSRDNRLEVYCETGKVRVVSGNTILLSPGMKAQTMNGSKLQIIKAEQKHEGLWQQGDFWFKNAPLTDVITEMERQFDVTIKYSNLGNRFYTGYFSRRSLIEALSTVLCPMQLKFKIEKKTIQIIK
jgi:ferric-dicitrate binding protein FerR (iron transport regulator)